MLLKEIALGLFEGSLMFMMIYHPAKYLLSKVHQPKKSGYDAIKSDSQKDKLIGTQK